MSVAAGFDFLDGAPVAVVEQWISDALDELGVDSDEVAQSLAQHTAVAGTDFDEDPVALYLQAQVDPEQSLVRIDVCDVNSVSFLVLNPDEITWTQAVTPLPTPVMLFCCRADAGDFPHLVTPSLADGAG